jgi:hypothetical protein
MSPIRRSECWGPKTYVPRERYSLMMSFCVVPASRCATSLGERSGFCSSATTWYIASSHIAVALIVIEVFISVSGMSAKSLRISPRWGTGTPTLPTSPRLSGLSGS